MSLYNKDGTLKFPVVIKYSGLLEGKGVVIAKNWNEFRKGFAYLAKLVKERHHKDNG